MDTGFLRHRGRQLDDGNDGRQLDQPCKNMSYDHGSSAFCVREPRQEKKSDAKRKSEGSYEYIEPASAPSSFPDALEHGLPVWRK